MLKVIDSRAIVDPSAEIDETVEIGPFSIIGPKVKIGKGSWIGPHVVIKGPCTIGEDNKIYQFASVAEDPQDKKYADEETTLEIGHRNIIRENATLHRGTIQENGKTIIGDDNLLMAYTHVAHDVVMGNNIILANAASLAGHVTVGDYAILGGFTIVHQFCQIGTHCFASMGSSISRDVPPYVMVGGQPTAPHGLNMEGLKRRGFPDDCIKDIRKAYKLLYKSKLKFTDAIIAVEELSKNRPNLVPFVQFLKSSSRSVIR